MMKSMTPPMVNQAKEFIPQYKGMTQLPSGQVPNQQKVFVPSGQVPKQPFAQQPSNLVDHMNTKAGTY
jgi:hypothetical protein